MLNEAGLKGEDKARRTARYRHAPRGGHLRTSHDIEAGHAVAGGHQVPPLAKPGRLPTKFALLLDVEVFGQLLHQIALHL